MRTPMTKVIAMAGKGGTGKKGGAAKGSKPSEKDKTVALRAAEALGFM